MTDTDFLPWMTDIQQRVETAGLQPRQPLLALRPGTGAQHSPQAPPGTRFTSALAAQAIKPPIF